MEMLLLMSAYLVCSAALGIAAGTVIALDTVPVFALLLIGRVSVEPVWVIAISGHPSRKCPSCR